jgi:hypothetical protein
MIALICITGPDGEACHINTDTIVRIRRAEKSAPPGSRCCLDIYSGLQYCTESIDEVLRKIRMAS